MTSRRIRKRLQAPLCAALLAACAGRAPAPTAPPDLGKRGVAERGMVASAHPLASDAGVEMLRAGGNAVDAAVAAAFAVGVVEPMMSGIGGGGGMLVWTQGDRRADYLDFYPTAGAAVDTTLRSYRGPSATPRGVGVPGAVAGLLDAHARWGRLPREAVLAPAIRLAEEGFPVGPLLARTTAGDSAKIAASPGAARIFLPGGRPIRAGERLVQPELAATLRRVAAEGRDGFYRGSVAEEIVAVLNRGGNPMTTADLADYRSRWRRPLCGEYRGAVLLSAAPPQSGMHVIEAMHLLEPYDLPALGHPTRSGRAFHVLTSALRTAVADRSAYVGDPDRAYVPAAGVASREYARERAAHVGAVSAAERIPAGDPRRADALPPSPRCRALEPFPPAAAAPTAPGPAAVRPEAAGDEGYGETTHLSAVDAEGNAVSLTYTQGLYFGTGSWAAGTFLNSALLNFSDNPESPNALGSGRVPASTIAPTIVLDGDRVRLVIGSPASGRIPPAIVQALVYTLDFGMDPLEALRMPRLFPSSASPVVRVEDGFPGAVLGEAVSLGYRIEAAPPADLFFGGVHLIERRDGRWVGAADPRRNGEVRGH